MANKDVEAKFEIKEDTLSPKLKRMPGEIQRFLVAVFEFHARKAETYMRLNAPWTDRTSNARNGLRAKAQHTPVSHTLVMYHTMPYGIWLEVRWNGKYQIIAPTQQVIGPQLAATIAAGLARMEAR